MLGLMDFHSYILVFISMAKRISFFINQASQENFNIPQQICSKYEMYIVFLNKETLTEKWIDIKYQ